jgi:hypothetical protein
MQIVTGLLLASSLMAAPAAASDSPIAGTWTAQLHNQPCIKLTVNDHGGKQSGNITFYLLILEDGAWKVKGADAVDLIYPRLEGKEFVFDVIHAKKHGSTDPEDQEIKTFRMQLTGKNEAVFKNAPGGDLILKRKVD